MEQTVENFHGCYLLRSENPRFKGRTYIGYSVDPNRRQKQHNRGRKFGGAVRTATRGPWTVVVIVYGFMTNIAALQFEWAWQHPEESRRLKHVSKKLSREKALDYRLRIMAEMLCVDPWRRLPLTVQWLRTPPGHIAILNGAVKAKKVTKAKPNEEPDVVVVQDSANDANEATGNVRCRLCMDMVQESIPEVPGILGKPEAKESHTLTCLITACAAKFHVLCLAKEFLKDDPAFLVPLKGNCPVCKTDLLWADLIRFKKGFYRDCVVEAEGIKNLADLSSEDENE